MKSEVNQWRTVSVAVLGMLLLLAGLWIAGDHPGAVSVYPSFAGGIGVVIGAVAVKAWGQHAANAKADAAKG